MTSKILCIEDNYFNLRLIRKMVAMLGYNVIEAATGLSGLFMLQSENPDLILLDINLPDIDGLEVTRRIRSNVILAHIPIIAVTANAMYGDRELYLAAGCDGYIAKPIMQIELKNLIHYHLNAAK